MIALLAAAATTLAAATATPPPAFPPEAVLARYAQALAGLREPRVFTVDYTLEQTGARRLDQRHRIFRNGTDERDETTAVNGNRPSLPVVRIFRRRPYRYTVAALAPKRSAYDFVFAGPHRDGKHVDYVFTLVPKRAVPGLALTQLTIDGVSFLPQSISFASALHAARGSVTFGKVDRYWVARGASAQAGPPGPVARERLAFAAWRFPKALPASTFSTPRPFPTVPAPALLP